MRADIRKIQPPPDAVANRAVATWASEAPKARPSIRKPNAPPAAASPPRASLRKHPRVVFRHEEPVPPVGAGRLVHLVLVVVAVNIIACLLAGKAASVADREIKMALSPMTAGRGPSPDPRGADAGVAAQFTLPAPERPGVGPNGGRNPY